MTKIIGIAEYPQFPFLADPPLHTLQTSSTQYLEEVQLCFFIHHTFVPISYSIRQWVVKCLVCMILKCALIIDSVKVQCRPLAILFHNQSLTDQEPNNFHFELDFYDMQRPEVCTRLLTALSNWPLGLPKLPQPSHDHIGKHGERLYRHHPFWHRPLHHGRSGA